MINTGEKDGWRGALQSLQDQQPALVGSLQGRRELLPGQRSVGYECTISVPSLDATVEAIQRHQGRIIMPKSTIPGVGSLVFFEDTEGNAVGAMQYEKDAK
jgi:uncharacterized protein